MKKAVKRIVSMTLCAATVCSLAVPLVGCKDAVGKKYNAETDPITFSIDALDGNFNPFFATSASDVTIAAQTQISMITTDAEGNPVAGEDEPTVARSFKQTMKDKDGQETKEGANAVTTEYEFIIKDDVLFSDGTPLTIKDVLFNLYVYLDPMYMGSATIYSTDIKGLNAYRWQDPDALDDQESDAEGQFKTAAQKRITNMLNHLDEPSKYPETDEIKADIEKVRAVLKEDIQSDWTAIEGTIEGYKEKYRFTEDWEIFYFTKNLISYQYEATETGNKRREEDGKYFTTLDPNKDGTAATDGELKKDIEEAAADETAITAAMNTYKCDRAQAIKYIKRDTAIDVVYARDFLKSSLADVIRYTVTGANVREDFVAEARSAYYEEQKANNDGELLVKNISGIEVNPDGQATRDHENKALVDPCDVLRITINGVDPKAIWNFAFSVAPMHYYSDKAHYDAAMADTEHEQHFGVEFNNQAFFDGVLQAPAKNALPVGAGAYMATDSKGNTLTNGDGFYVNNVVYYKRNDNFKTVGDKLNNAKIKYLRYQVIGSDQILNSLATQDIDVGEPTAKKANVDAIKNYAHLDYEQYRTNGYGYVGINPKFVPDIEVRQAIMKAMNRQLIMSYYTDTLAEIIERPMSTESWAYPKNEDGTKVDVHENVEYTRTASDITSLVEKAGWRRADSNSVYAKDGKTLTLTFVIAGETTDHPAYDMFQDAADWLNENCGFDITVITKVTALADLAQGNLAVWAAAWSSSIDPDLYQVYHKDSTATSIKNWGYKEIFADTTKQFTYEQGIINQLSELIETARETLNQDERKEDYAEALDLIMQLCVELPTYQRNDLVVFNKTKINVDTINRNPNSNSGVFDRIWEVNYN